jgi:hypothetical protein
MLDNFLAITTDKKVLDGLREAARRAPSPEDQLEQRVSFVYSSMSEKSGITREQVRDFVVSGAQPGTNTAR